MPFARAFKDALGVPAIAVGMLEDPQVAAKVLENGDADLVAVARGMLRDPYWATRAIKETGGSPREVAPAAYQRAY